MVDTTTNESFQLFADGETPWEHRSDFEKLDNIFGGARTVTAFATGSLAFEQGLQWEEDDNSPFTISNSASGQYTLAGTYDVVKLIVVSTSNLNSFIQMQVNGDTGPNYNFVDNSNTRTAGANEWDNILLPDFGVGQTIDISGRWNGDCVFANTPAGGTASMAMGGDNGNVTSPLDTITLADDGGVSFDVTARVLGGTGV